MARIKLTLNPETPEHQRVLLHGSSNSGKTFLAGSAMLSYVDQGKSVYFIDTKGEEGTRSISAFGLGPEVAETIEDYDDFVDCLKDVKGKDLLVVDSLKFIWKFIMLKVLKSDRAPVISKTSTDWTDLYRLYDRMLFDLTSVSRDLIVICPSDISMDQVKGETKISPDLPGRKIPDTVGYFDLVGYMENSPIGTKSRRVVHFEGLSGGITKIRASKQALTKPVVLTEGPGAWADLQEVLDEHI